jgi:hypothetical protein
VGESGSLDREDALDKSASALPYYTVQDSNSPESVRENLGSSGGGRARVRSSKCGTSRSRCAPALGLELQVIGAVRSGFSENVSGPERLINRGSICVW